MRLNAPLRRRQPVRLLVGAGAGVLEVEVEGAVRVVFERHPAADREPVEAVRHLEAVTVIQRDRPEGVHRRRGVLVEMQDIGVRTVQRLASIVREVERIDRVLRQVRAETELGDDRALQVVVAVDAHRVGVHRPAVDDAGKAGDLPCHQLQGVLGRGLQPRLDRRIDLVDVEALAPLDPDPLHLGEDRLIGDVRRLQLQDLGGVGEELAGRHRIDRDLRRRLHVDGGIDSADNRLGRLTPARQRRDLVAGLDRVHRVVVGGPVGLGAADDPDIRRGRVDANHARRQRAVPARRHHGVIGGLGAGGAPARRGEHVGPHVEHRQQVVAPMRIGHRDDHRLLGQVEPGAGIQRVEVRPDHDLHVRRRERGKVGEGVHRRVHALGLGDVGQLLARNVHCDERIEIQVGRHADRSARPVR